MQYNNLLQPSVISATLNGNTIQSMSYGYGISGANNGDISTIVNNLNSAARTQTFTYDQMDRVASAHDGVNWGESYVYDNWGNLYQNNGISGYPNGGHWSVIADTHNRLSNLSYDAAGEVTQDQYSNQYTYDGEGRILTAGAGSYTYDGDGDRVKKLVGAAATLYWPGGSAVLNESDSTGATMARQVYLGGAMTWHESTAGNGVFLLGDHLGSVRITGDAAGNLKDDIDYYPFGSVAYNYGNAPSDNHYKFTGYESDDESSTDYAVFRNHSYSISS